LAGAPLTEAGGKVAETHARVGRPDAEIVRFAEEIDIDAGLLVLGSRDPGPLIPAMMGGVADSVQSGGCSELTPLDSFMGRSTL
jgi:nucleotide-binding universal stress UspA family protein